MVKSNNVTLSTPVIPAASNWLAPLTPCKRTTVYLPPRSVVKPTEAISFPDSSPHETKSILISWISYLLNCLKKATQRPLLKHETLPL